MIRRNEPPKGTHANAWNSVATGVATNSPGTLDTGNLPWVSAFGHVSGSCTITLMYSQDGVNWYAGPTTTLVGAVDFRIDQQTAARYVALQSDTNVTATATLSAKG